MRKLILCSMVFCFILAVTASTAKADPCQYHQWTRKYCKADAPAAPVYTPPPRPERVILEGVYFDTGKATIKAESFEVLDRNISKLSKNKDVMITVVGYTDNVGSDSNNQRLSEARAKTVRDYFVSKGVNAHRINSEGRGESNPIASNSTTEGRAQNRRIEIETTK